MCLGIVMKIKEIKEKEGIGEFYGVKKRIRIDLLEGVNIGDYVLVHAGFGISKLETNEAKERMKLLKEVMELR